MPRGNASTLKTILIDMDGVIWRGYQPIVDIRHLFDRIDNLGCQAYCVTNNSTETVQGYLEKMGRFGVDLSPDQMVTSGEATADFLKERFPQSGSVFVVGEEGLKSTISSHGFNVTENTKDQAVRAVVVGLDFSLSYQKIYLAANLIRDGVLFIGTNPDKTFPAPNGVAPGAGAIISPIEAASGRSPLIIGKPEIHLYQLAMKRAGSSPEQTLMIGDRLETDILGAQRTGMRTALVLSGIASKKEAEDWRPAPDLVGETIIDILEMIEIKE